MSSMKHQKCMTSSRMTSKAPSILGKGQFSIFLPRRMDSEYYVKSPVKVKAEMFLYPKQLGVGGLCLRSIPCSAKVQKLTEDNHFDIVNVPIKIEAEVLLSPGFNHSSRRSTPHSKFDLSLHVWMLYCFYSVASKFQTNWKHCTTSPTTRLMMSCLVFLVVSHIANFVYVAWNEYGLGSLTYIVSQNSFAINIIEVITWAKMYNCVTYHFQMEKKWNLNV